MKVVIVVPAFNESAVIFDVLKSLPRKLKGVSKVIILVVNDGSKDQTLAEAKRANVNVASHVINRGLGAAIKTGISWAQRNRADIIITFDADGQHDPQDIPGIAGPLLNDQADLVIGSRFKKKQKVPYDRLILNWFANIASFLLFGVFSTDSQSGMRGFSKKAAKLINFKSDRMEFSSEILLEAKRNDLRVKEVPIRAIYTPYSREKGQKNLNAIPVLARSLVKLLR